MPLTLRGLLDRAVGFWRSSLQLRTIAITVLLSGFAILVIGGYMSFSVGTNLFDSRRDQLIATTATATLAGQRVFDDATDSAVEELDATIQDAANQIIAAAGGAGTSLDRTRIAILRGPEQDGQGPAPIFSPGLDVDSIITPEIRAQVVESPDRRVFSQPVEVARDDETEGPGLVTGAALDVRGLTYELYLIYDITDAQETLAFVQQTLAIGGLALILLIGAVTYVVVRLVVGPVQVAAETSRRLAAGDLEVRIPERGDDELATLARSFNGMAAAMQGQITRLAELSQVQQRFVSDVSHELRTPLTTIRLAGDVLHQSRDAFDPTSRRTTELLHTQVQRFESLLADLLEMSRYDAGAVEMEVEPTNLVRLAEEAIDSLSALAATKGSELRLVAPGGYFEAEVDARRIRRIISNLLGNAIDHGESMPIVIHVDSDEKAVAIAVRDYGIGMTQEQLGRVFDRFWRADPSRQRTTGGTGLGLAISLEDAALHGGRLEVWSMPGMGSCFLLTLPRTRGAELVGSPLPLPPDEPLEEVRDEQ